MNIHNHWKTTWAFMVLIWALNLSGCGQGGSGAGNNNAAGQSQLALLDQINQRFPFTANRPIDVIYAYQRVNSQLLYYFDFNSNGTFDLYSTLNNNQFDDVNILIGTFSNGDLQISVDQLEAGAGNCSL